MRFMPATAVWLLDTVLFGLVLTMAAGQIGHLLSTRGRDDLQRSDAGGVPGMATMAMIVVLMLKWAMLVSLPVGMQWWPSDWRRVFNFVYPRPIYRALILAPLWGRWGILLAAGIGRTARGCDPVTASLCRAVRPTFILASVLVPILLSGVYCSHKNNRLIGVIMGLVVLAVTFIGTVIMTRRTSGQTRSSLLATGLLSELTFLACYLGFGRYIGGW